MNVQPISTEVTLGHFGTADHFGASTILDGADQNRSVSIEAYTTLQTLALPREAFGALLDKGKEGRL